LGASQEVSGPEAAPVEGMGAAGGKAFPPPSWLALLRGAAVTAGNVPTALLLPQLNFVGAVTSILCARDANSEASVRVQNILQLLRSGERVRILPDAGVYEFDGLDTGGYWLRLLDANSRGSSGRFWVPQKEAPRIEPTRRKRPIGKANRHEWHPLRLTPWDLFAKSHLAGNAALAHLRVVLVGSRSEFADALNVIGFDVQPGEAARSVAEGLPWGIVTDSGELELVRPHRASGTPVIAVARDHTSARRLAARFEPRSLVIVSDQYEDALTDRTSVEALADRQACLVLAPSRLREEFIARRNDRWAVAELSHLSFSQDERLGIRELDRVSVCSSWMRKSPVVLAETSLDLEDAFRRLDCFTRAANPHLDLDDDVTEAVRLLRQSFFDASDWLAAPTQDDFNELSTDREAVSRLLPRLRSLVGLDAVADVRAALSALDRFAEEARNRAMTPKGEALARIANSSSRSAECRHVVVSGHRRSAAAATSFLQQLGTPLDCVTPSELQSMDGVGRAIALSILRRESFIRLVDPWAAPELLFLGYQHEVEIYRQRLSARQRLITKLRPDAALVARLPQLSGDEPSAFDTDPKTTPKLVEPTIVAPIPVRRPQPSRSGEQTKSARFCRFAGRSWMAMTDDHAVARLHVSSGHKARVSTDACRNLQVGDLILIREGGEKDIVREVAEQLAGYERYGVLRKQAGYWRQTLRSYSNTPERLQEALASEGLERGLATIRDWISHDGPIGPSDPETSLPLIASAVGQSADGKPWKDCLDAIQAVRRYHVNAGFRLTKVLVEECGEAIREHSEHETAFELSVGLVWLLEIEQVDAERQEWPSTQTNKIQWDSDNWRRRLLRRTAKHSRIALDELFPDLGDQLDEVDL